MRYLHEDVAEIAKFIESKKLNLFHLDVIGQQTPRVTGVNALEHYFGETQHLWGSFPETYFIVTHENRCNPTPVHEAVERVETEASAEFALVGYNDGGVVSISNRKLPFQDHAKPFPNWEPINFSKPPTLVAWIDRLAALFGRRSRTDRPAGD